MHRFGLIAAFSIVVGLAHAEPLSLARQGWLYVGGHPVTIDGHDYLKGSMYAEYFVPAQQTHRWPVVMVHGGSMSGTNYTGTPDGREGWAQYFVRHGYAVYVVDQVGRGRSAFTSAMYGPATLVDRKNSLTRFIAQEHYNQWPQAHLHTQWPGAGTIDDPASMQLAMSNLPAIDDFDEQQQLNRDALIALLERIGPSVLLVHSQAGAYGWPVADARPDLVRAIVAIEPNGPPVHDVEFKGPPGWFADNPRVKPYALGSDPLTYDPVITDPSQLKFVQQDAPADPSQVRCWLQAAPAHQLPRLQRMPILVVTSEASYHAPYDGCTVAYLRQAGVKPTWIKLADIGIHGNSHMMMVEKNNAQIANVLVNWLDKTLH